MVLVEIPREFGYVVLVALGMQIQVSGAAMAIGKMRKKHNVPYPDMGCGRYAAKLDDKAWKEFNCVQRVHQNYLEFLPMVLANLLIGGIFHPKVQASLGVVYMVARYIYGSGYNARGPEGRMVGAGLGFLTMYSMIGVTAYSTVKLLGWF